MSLFNVLSAHLENINLNIDNINFLELTKCKLFPLSILTNAITFTQTHDANILKQLGRSNCHKVFRI